jgi:hypothetical protein
MLLINIYLKKRETHPHCLVAKRDLQRLRETTPSENSLLGGFRW